MCLKCASQFLGGALHVTLLIVLPLLGVLFLLHKAREDKRTDVDRVRLTAMISLGFMTLQSFQVFKQLGMDWPSVFDALGLTFPLNVAGALADSQSFLVLLRLGCLVGPSSVKLYHASVALFAACYLCVAVLCGTARVLLPRHMPAYALANGITWLSSTFFITLVVAAARPLQCVPHPENAPWGDLSSVKDYPEILCEHEDHTGHTSCT